MSATKPPSAQPVVVAASAGEDGVDPAIAATSPALPRATVKLQPSAAPGKPVSAPTPVPAPKATVPLASAPSATVALPKGAVPVAATVAAPVIKKVPTAPQPTEDPMDETEVDVADEVSPVSGLDKMLASVAVVVALLSTLTSFWAYAALK